jgi:biopolymer transport protein ExbD
MNENAPLPENPVDEPPQPSDDKIIQGDTNFMVSIPSQQGAVINLPQPPAVEKTLVENSLAVSVSAQQDAEVNNSLVFSTAVGHDLTSINSLETNVAVGNDLKLQQGGAIILKVGGQAQVEGSTIGLLVAKSEATLTNTRVLMTTQQAIALGAAFGAVYALLRTLLRGKKKGD